MDGEQRDYGRIGRGVYPVFVVAAALICYARFRTIQGRLRVTRAIHDTIGYVLTKSAKRDWSIRPST